MNKIWISENHSKDIVVAYADNIIYRGNPKPDLINDYVIGIKNNQIPEDLFGIPVSYIKEINLSESKNYIEIMFSKDSIDNLTIKNDVQRKEVFDFFKDNFDNFIYKLDKYSPLKAAKKPLIALLIVSLIFLYTLSIANEIQLGAEYEIHGNGVSLAAIVLMLALLGAQKVVMIFSVPILIAIGAAILKAKNPPTVHRLILKK